MDDLLPTTTISTKTLIENNESMRIERVKRVGFVPKIFPKSKSCLLSNMRADVLYHNLLLNKAPTHIISLNYSIDRTVASFYKVNPTSIEREKKKILSTWKSLRR